MEELIVKRQKHIISKLVHQLAKENMNLYYTDSKTISSLVVEKIKQNTLPKKEIDLVQNLTREDIHILLSYNSNCC